MGRQCRRRSVAISRQDFRDFFQNALADKELDSEFIFGDYDGNPEWSDFDDAIDNVVSAFLYVDCLKDILDCDLKDFDEESLTAAQDEASDIQLFLLNAATRLIDCYDMTTDEEKFKRDRGIE